MSRLDNALLLARVGAFWVMGGLFTLGATIFAARMFMPNALLGTNMGNFVQQALTFASKSAPYVWLGLTVNQLTLMALLVHISSVLSLLTWPKTSGLIVFGLTFWRQMFLRMHVGDPSFPNSPICMFKSQTCPAMDVFHVLMVLSGVLIFTSPAPLPETTLTGLKISGLDGAWIDRVLGKLKRSRSPRRQQTTVHAETHNRKRQ